MTGAQLGKLREPPGPVHTGWGTVVGGNIYKFMMEENSQTYDRIVGAFGQKLKTYKENQAMN